MSYSVEGMNMKFRLELKDGVTGEWLMYDGHASPMYLRTAAEAICSGEAALHKSDFGWVAYRVTPIEDNGHAQA